MLNARSLFAGLALALLGANSASSAQTPARDPSARLREVLPADVAERILARIARARSRDLPATALEHRALKFAAKGVRPADIERSVAEHLERMERAKAALEKGRGTRASDDEIEAGAEVMRRGVDGSKVSELARTAPSGRSLAVPLFVIGSLVDRGLPSDSAHARVLARLTERASDADLERMQRDPPPQARGGNTNRPAETGRDLAATKRPGSAAGGARGSGPPSGVPANGGRRARPDHAGTAKPGTSGTGGQGRRP
jgi:hypothetical protein